MLNMSPIAGFCSRYLFRGLLFSAAFAFWGAKQLDAGMKQTSWGIKFLLIPGGIAYGRSCCGNGSCLRDTPCGLTRS